MGMYSGLNIHEPQTQGFSGNMETPQNMHLGSLHRVGMCESKFVLLLVISGGTLGKQWLNIGAPGDFLKIRAKSG